MFNKHFFLSLFLLVCLSRSLFSEIVQYENQLIENVEIIVHAKSGDIVDENAISTRLRTQKGGFFSQTDFDEDLKILAKDFDRTEPQITAGTDGLYVVLDIWPKPTISTIRWEGNYHICTSELQKELSITCFSTFDRQAFNLAFHKLKAYYISHGYFEAELDYIVNFDCEKNEVVIVIQIKEGRSGKIQDIRFVNFTDCEKCEILKEMITKKYNLFMSWYTEEGTYNEDAVQQDRLIITNYLQNRGYADAVVEIDVTESCKTERIIVTITAEKGAYYRFGRLAFEGNCVIESSAINQLFTILPGDAFSIEKLATTIEAITDAYGVMGYVDADIDYELDLDENHYLYNVHFKINEGEQFRVGLIRIFGNSITKASVILHETILVPGEIFNTIKLKATETRLLNIGYFKNVNAYIVKGSESSLLGGSYRDVYIEVEETGTGQFQGSIGYSSVEEIFGSIGITERNFNHEGFYYYMRDGLKAFRGGGEFAEINLQIGQKSREYGLSWTKPYFMDTDWTIGCDLSNNCTRYISEEYDLETVTLGLRAYYDLNAFVRFGLQYRLKNGHVDLHHAKHNKGLKHDAKIADLISAFGPSISYDSTNHPVKPTEGFRSRLFLEYAGIGGDHHFLNVSYLNTYYFPVGSRFVLKYRADFRFIQPLGSTSFDSVPMDERIFLGGDFMVRGFRPYRLGPSYHGSKANRDVPKGGISMQLYSIECTRRIIEDLEVYAFCDAGHLSGDTWEFGRLSVSIGYGARFKLISSIPPVTIGMGYPLNAHNRSDVKKFFFSFGGNF